MAGNFKKISICTLTFIVIGVLEQAPVLALTIASTQATSITESSPGVSGSQVVNVLSNGEITDETNSEKNELLLLATRNMEEIIQASEVSVVTIDETTRYYIAQTPVTKQDTFTPAYRNVWVKPNDVPPKRKVPEPSTVLGLMSMIGWFGTQRKGRTANKSGSKIA
ncbi:hypothetical protein A6770_11135 [Nostoc minutum NIES-26]|uniref:PEP-CTERM protein-sorting domain-containing protein n=1 Tax=Nostoc minutum NIES-26 TaxID=1844469 RepID=A0A367RUJ2_9NOSO|nr:hypothetical protein A6770_11135 [Nostoc minutum NIES-26]